VSTFVGRVPDVYVPSDREIPRSVNEGTPIVAAKRQAPASKAFRKLADRYSRPSSEKPKTPSKASGGGSTVRDLIMGRKR
jgi:MinD-like ATPase involved in chromosome partitioning or flagellar assembly